jgi:hypothetical protein
MIPRFDNQAVAENRASLKLQQSLWGGVSKSFRGSMACNFIRCPIISFWSFITKWLAGFNARNERAGENENQVLISNRQPESCWELIRRNPSEISTFLL